MRLGDSRRKENTGEPSGSPSPQCVYNDKGYCLFFLHLNKEKKEIPEDILKKGCKHFYDKKNSHPLFLKFLIEFSDIS